MIGSSELLLTMGALIIFGLYAMQANRSMVTADTWSIENETQLEAAKIGEAIIHQAAALPFDIVVAEDPLPGNDVEQLTPRSAFGINDGEKDKRPAAVTFDDFDKQQFTESGIFGEYVVNTEVWYVDPITGLNIENDATRSLRKRLIVTISHPNLNSDITMRYTKSYH